MRWHIDRRAFLRAGGATFLSALAPRSAEALDRSETLYASAYQTRDGGFGAAILSDEGAILMRLPLPARGHDVVVSPTGAKAVVFARRPGSFACAFAIDRSTDPLFFSCPQDRHFYGHGTFSEDGSLLFATENDFANARGVIGIYDATDGFRRRREFHTHGTGPHDVQLMPGGRVLAVAVGGIETHPDYGRTKLNIATMQPSLTLLDASDGSLVDRVALPQTLSKVSLRHLAGDGDGRLWVAGQFEGEPGRLVPLVFAWSAETGLKQLHLPRRAVSRLRGYVGSVAYNARSGRLAFSSPRGGVVVTCAADKPVDVSIVEHPGASGVSPLLERFVSTSLQGSMRSGSTPAWSTPLHWDNHLSTIR